MEVIIKNILIYNTSDNYFDETYAKKLLNFSRIDLNKFIELSTIIFELSNELRKTNNQKIIGEIYFIKMALLFIENKAESYKTEKITLEKEVNSSNTENKTNEEPKKEDDTNDVEQQDLTKIKVNNALSGANKELKNEFIREYSKIKEYVSVKEYNAISNLMLKATPEVVSDKTILFTFKNNFEVVLFEKNIQDIQKLLKVVYNKKYDLVAIIQEEWEKIKVEYINNIKSGKKYEYIEIKESKKKNNKNTELQNSVESIFGSDYITM